MLIKCAFSPPIQASYISDIFVPVSLYLTHDNGRRMCPELPSFSSGVCSFSFMPARFQTDLLISMKGPKPWPMTHVTKTAGCWFPAVLGPSLSGEYFMALCIKVVIMYIIGLVNLIQLFECQRMHPVPPVKIGK